MSVKLGEKSNTKDCRLSIFIYMNKKKTNYCKKGHLAERDEVMF